MIDSVSTGVTSVDLAADRLDADRHCVFRCYDNWFAINATAVREITFSPHLSIVPGSHSLLAGICHLRSEFLPVIRIDALLGDGPVDQCDDQKLLVLGSGTAPWAILISEVAALVALDTLTGGDMNVDDPISSVLLGTAMFGDEVVRVLDAHHLQQWSQRQLEHDWRTFASTSTSSGIQ